MVAGGQLACDILSRGVYMRLVAMIVFKERWFWADRGDLGAGHSPRGFTGGCVQLLTAATINIAK